MGLKIEAARTATRLVSKPVVAKPANMLKTVDSIFKYDDNQAASGLNSERTMLQSSENPLNSDRSHQDAALTSS